MTNGMRDAGCGTRKVVVGALCALLAVMSCSSNGDQGVRETATTDSASRFPLPASREASRGTILFAGTSLTAGLGLEPEDSYPTLVQQKLDSAGLRYQVVNA